MMRTSAKLLRPVGEESLQAYVDGAVAPEERLAVEAYLAEHPREADRVKSYLEQNRTFHELFDHHLVAPLPKRAQETLSELKATIVRRGRKRRTFGVAASVALLVAGAAGGWIAQNQGSPDEPHAMRLAAPEAHDEDMANRLDASIPTAVSGEAASFALTHEEVSATLSDPPDLSGQGFHLIGGRALSLRDDGSIQLYYENELGARLTVHVSAANDHGEASFVALQDQGRSILLWQRNGLVFSVVGQVDYEHLTEIARAIDGTPSSSLADAGDALPQTALEDAEFLAPSDESGAEPVASAVADVEAPSAQSDDAPTGEDDDVEPIVVEPLSEPEKTGSQADPATAPIQES